MTKEIVKKKPKSPCTKDCPKRVVGCVRNCPELDIYEAEKTEYFKSMRVDKCNTHLVHPHDKY